MSEETKTIEWQHPDYEEPGEVLAWVKVCIHADGQCSLEFENNSKLPAGKLIEKVYETLATLPKFPTKPTLVALRGTEEGK